MKTEISPEGKGLHLISSGDPQDTESEARENSSSLTRIEKLKLVDKAAIVVGIVETLRLMRELRHENPTQKKILSKGVLAGISFTVSSIAIARIRRLEEGQKPQIAEIDY